MIASPITGISTSSPARAVGPEEPASKPPRPEPKAQAVEPEPAAVVSISAQAASQAEEAAPKSNKPDLAYEPADTDKDGKISTYEQQSYDFRRPPDLSEYTRNLPDQK